MKAANHWQWALSLAQTGYDVMTNPSLLQKIKIEFQRGGYTDNENVKK